LIGADDRFETDAPRANRFESSPEIEERLRWLDSFYNKPVCRKCKFTAGRRNAKPVTLTYAGQYDGVCWLSGNRNFVWTALMRGKGRHPVEKSRHRAAKV
jgi:hypothetical protein